MLLEAPARECGEDIIDLFCLPVKRNGRVDCAVFGDKTPCGLARTLLRLFDEETGNVDEDDDAACRVGQRIIQTIEIRERGIRRPAGIARAVKALLDTAMARQG